MTACPNAVLHPWLKRELAEILAAMPGRRRAAAGGVRPGSAGRRASRSSRRCSGAAAAADAPGAGQPGRAQDAGVGLLAVRARDHAAVHAGGRVVAEHGREPAADPQAAGAGRPVPDRHRPRSSPGSRRRRGTGTRPRRRSCGAASGRPAGGGSASVATASAARGPAHVCLSCGRRGPVMATRKPHGGEKEAMSSVACLACGGSSRTTSQATAGGSPRPPMPPSPPASASPPWRRSSPPR